MAAGVRRVRGHSRTSPRFASAPAGTMFSPAATLRWISTVSPVRKLYSTMTTESAPAGTGAPVMISTAWPGSTSSACGGPPARISPTSFRRAGVDIRGADRVTVAGGARKGGEVAVGEHGFGEHAAAGEEQFAPLSFGRRDLRRGLLDPAACGFEGENRGRHQGGDFIANELRVLSCELRVYVAEGAGAYNSMVEGLGLRAES